MKPDRTVRRELNRLRRIGIEGNGDPALTRVSQAIEYGIRWAREETRGWDLPLEEAGSLAAIMRQELISHD